MCSSSLGVVLYPGTAYDNARAYSERASETGKEKERRAAYYGRTLEYDVTGREVVSVQASTPTKVLYS